MGSVDRQPMRVSFQVAHEVEVEAKLARALRDTLPVLGVGNNAPLMPGFKHHIPKIQLHDEHWRETLEELLQAAELIVTNIQRLTPGVMFELDLIRKYGREDRTVVVLSPPDTSLDALKQAFDAEGPDYPQARRDSEILMPLPRIVQQSEVPFDNLEGSPAFADVLQRARHLSMLPAAERSWDSVF